MLIQQVDRITRDMPLFAAARRMWFYDGKALAEFKPREEKRHDQS